VGRADYSDAQRHKLADQARSDVLRCNQGVREAERVISVGKQDRTMGARVRTMGQFSARR
jgi:hypothetical protein